MSRFSHLDEDSASVGVSHLKEPPPYSSSPRYRLVQRLGILVVVAGGVAA